MNRLLLICLFSLGILSCRKGIDGKQDVGYLENVKFYLKDSVTATDYAELEFERSLITRLYGGKLTFLKIPFKGKSIFNDFVLLQTEEDGNYINGRVISISKLTETEPGRTYTFNGKVVIQSLSRRWTIKSDIIDGYIQAFHVTPSSTNATLRRVVPEPVMKGELPEVVVVGHRSSVGNGISTFNFILLQGLFGRDYHGVDLHSEEIGGGGYYSGGYPVGGSYDNRSGEDREGYRNGDDRRTGNAIEQAKGYIDEEETIFIDFEFVERLQPLEVEKYLKCFSNIPDNGSTCSIEILADIPVDKDPNKFFDWKTGSPGHTFLQIKKSNGSKTVMQNIGFYPVDSWKTTLTPAPIQAKFVDNGNHEFNAGLLMNITPEELKKVLMHIEYLAKFVKYDIDDYNCTDFALDVFNQVRISNPLEIPKYTIPNGAAAIGTSTPQGLYNKLKSMQQNGTESGNINIPGVKGWVAQSHGPCD